MGQKRAEPMKHPDLVHGIEETRGDMHGTINAIEERLSPAHLREQLMEQLEQAKGTLKTQATQELTELRDTVKSHLKDEMADIKHTIKTELEDAKAAVRAATIGKVETMVHNASETVSEARTTVVDTVRANPIPAALIALGVGWMIYNARSSRSTQTRQFSQGGGTFDRAKHLGGDAAIKVREVTHAAGEAASHFVHDAKDTVSHLADNAKGAASDVAHRVGDVAGNVAGKARDGAQLVGTKAKEGAQFVSTGFETQMRDNPLAVGAVAFAIGTAAGLMIPTTRREDQLLGGMRDQLFEKAQHLAHDAVESAQQKMSEALGAAHGQDGHHA